MLKQTFFELSQPAPQFRFWLLQALIWGWYFLFMLLAIVLPRENHLIIGLLHLLSETLCGWFMGLILWCLFKLTREQRPFIYLVTSLISITLCASFWTLFKWISFYFFFSEQWQLPSLKGFGEWYLFSLKKN